MTTTTTWLDEQPADKVDAALTKYRTSKGPRTQRMRAHVPDDDRFGLWLMLADNRAIRRFGVGIFDIADWTWRDAYDGGMSPRDAVAEAFAADDMGWPVD